MRLAEVAVNLDKRNGGVSTLEGGSANRLIIPQNSVSHPNSTPLEQPNNHQAQSSNPSPHPSSQEVLLPTRKKRGKTMMKSLFLTGNEKIEVKFNDFGQPIGLNSTHLSSYLGALAREMVPMNISSWKKVGKPMKDDLWTCIQARFKLEAMHKSLFTKLMGQRWKEAKSRLVSAVRDASSSHDAANRLAMLKPDSIKSDQEWKDFIKEKVSEEFEKSESGCTDIDRDDLWSKGHTKKNGELPNAYVADCVARIKEYKRTQSSHEKAPLSEDGVAKTFGPEHNGRIRGLGFGVTPTQLGKKKKNSVGCSYE